MRRVVALALVTALCGCPRPKQAPASVVEPAAASDSDLERRRGLIGELQDEILTSYERDELPEVETLQIDPQVGPARIGVGPGDVYYGEDVARLASSRWPIQVVPGTPTDVRSKRLRISLSQDRAASAAWISDELSWRITMCGRTAVIPMRVTALYAHDGDRWVQVFEHLSFGRLPQPTVDGSLRGKDIPEATVDREVGDTLVHVLDNLISGQAARVKPVIATGATADDPTKPAMTYLLGPDRDAEWIGSPAEAIRLVDGKLELDRPRVGTIGRPDKATVAYYVGNVIADLRHHPGSTSGRTLMRATFVFEKRNKSWVVVQGHISEPIDDIDLAQLVYGTALISDKPLQITCDDGRRSTPPATR